MNITNVRRVEWSHIDGEENTVEVTAEDVKYKIEKSRSHDSGEYQVMEYIDNGNGEMSWRTCGIYFKEKDAIKAMNNIQEIFYVQTTEGEYDYSGGCWITTESSRGEDINWDDYPKFNRTKIVNAAEEFLKNGRSQQF
jgi:hypothetical protein